MLTSVDVERVKVWPRRNANGKYVLYETTYYKFFRHLGWRNVQKTKTRVWPPSKQANGRGLQFRTQKEALTYYEEQKGQNKC